MPPFPHHHVTQQATFPLPNLQAQLHLPRQHLASYLKPIPDSFAHVKAALTHNSLHSLNSNITKGNSRARHQTVKFGTKALRTKLHAINKNMIEDIKGLLQVEIRREQAKHSSVARLDATSKSPNVKVHVAESVIVSAMHKRSAEWEAKESEVKRARREHTPNASNMLVGLCERVSASGSGTNADGCVTGRSSGGGGVGGTDGFNTCGEWIVESNETDDELSDVQHMIAQLNESCMKVEMEYLQQISGRCAAATRAAWARVFPKADLSLVFPNEQRGTDVNPFKQSPVSVLDDYEQNGDPELTREQHNMARHNEAMLQMEIDVLERISRKQAAASRAKWIMAYPFCDRYYSRGGATSSKSVMLGNELPSNACLSVDGSKHRYVRC
eukprot:TRINITY_DN12_c1_g1_i6.p1 TRINITY_DN12_c1_g1~~TRINITY_DN12_c1_g1_i6.p1  ORF type:complete len:449 (-),score=59.86 TRINITY_DN12_c1_g1_i6:567-1721(-)